MLVAAVSGVFLIQYGLMKLNLFPIDLKKLTAWHILSLILIQAGVFLAISLVLILKFKIKIFNTGDEIKAMELLAGFGGLFAVNAVSSIFLLSFDAAPNQFQDFNVSLLKENAGLMIFTIAFIGPVYEEFIFRSVILGMLAYDISSKKLKVAAVFFSSFLFAGAHFRDILENYFIGFPLFLLGLYFAFWTLRKKGIMMPVVMHMTQNFLASIAMLYGKQV